MTDKSTISNLSPEIVLNIFSHYIKSEGPLEFLRNVPLVCKSWNGAASSPSLWIDVDWSSMSTKHLLQCGQRGFLAPTRTLNLKSIFKGKQDTSSLECLLPEDSLRIVNFCQNLNELHVPDLRVMNKEMMEVLVRKFPCMEKLFIGSLEVWTGQAATEYDFELLFRNFGKILVQLELQMILHQVEGLGSKIAASCPSLEVLHFFPIPGSSRCTIPVDEIQIGCPKLIDLTVRNCQLEISNQEEVNGFRNLKVFRAFLCNFRSPNMEKIFKNSTKLEALDLGYCENLVKSKMLEIPSEKLEELQLVFFEGPVEPLIRAVKRWRLTLRLFSIISLPRGLDISRVVEAYLEDNQNPAIEEVVVPDSNVSLNIIKKLLVVCPKLQRLSFSGGRVIYDLNGRERLLEFLKKL